MQRVREALRIERMRGLFLAMSLSTVVVDARAQVPQTCTSAHRCVTTLASGISGFDDVVVNGQLVCWSETDAIRCQPKPSGPVTTLVSGTMIYNLVIDSTNAYWMTMPGLHTMPLTGGAQRTLSPQSGLGFVVSAGAVYWSEYGSGVMEIKASPLPNGGVTRVERMKISSGHPTLATDGTAVYWLSDNEIHRRSVGSAISPFPFSPPFPAAPETMVVDAVHAYVLLADGEIVRMLKTGGSWTTIARTMPGTRRIVTDGASIFWFQRAGVIAKVPIAGGAVTTLSLPGVIAFAVDATSLYYASVDGTLRRVTPS